MGQVVRAWREARGLSVSQLAAQAGKPVTKDYVSKLEHGRIQDAGSKHRKRIAGVLNVPEVYLVVRKMPTDILTSSIQTAPPAQAGILISSSPPTASVQQEFNQVRKMFLNAFSALDQLEARVITSISNQEGLPPRIRQW